MRMECWLVGTCCWDNFRLLLNIVRAPSMPMQMVRPRQCGQCQRPDCPVSSSDPLVADLDTTLALVEQPFASSEMGESMDLLPELSGETWVTATLLEGLTADLLPAGANLNLIVASRQDTTLTTVREWVQSGVVPSWTDCAGFSPELRCWRLQIGNLSIDTDGR